MQQVQLRLTNNLMDHYIDPKIVKLRMSAQVVLIDLARTFRDGQ